MPVVSPLPRDGETTLGWRADCSVYERSIMLRIEPSVKTERAIEGSKVRVILDDLELAQRSYASESRYHVQIRSR